MLNIKKDTTIPQLDPVKFVQKGNGIIKGYAVNTFHGMIKNYNQDRVSIIMNITKPNFKGRWPKCSYFGVFDGHGGDSCSNFLKDNMHKYVQVQLRQITENQYFPNEPIEALKLGFKKAQTDFIKLAQLSTPPQRSGSCAIVLLFIDQICYIANVGDSRAILSSQKGSKIYSLSYDHKPDSQLEKTRIQKAGGKIYQSSIKTKNGITIPGPCRIIPGKLSVSRAFGDIQAKLQKWGGNQKVLIAKPQITYFEINCDQHDFIVMGSDGIFDKLTNQQVAECFWQCHDNRKDNYNYIGEASSKMLVQSMNKLSMDNITSLIIVFQDHGRLELPRKKNIRYLEDRSMESQKQNKIYQKQPINSKINQRTIPNKLSTQKMPIKRKNTIHHQSSVHQLSKDLKQLEHNNKQQKDLRRGSMKNLKKDNTMKILPAHRFDKSQVKDQIQISTFNKIYKQKNIQKIR